MSDNFPTDNGYPVIPEPIETIIPEMPEPAEAVPAPPGSDKPMPDRPLPDFIQELRDDQAAVGRDNVIAENKKRRRRGLDTLPVRGVE